MAWYYATEEQVRAALDSKMTARDGAQIRNALASATLSVNGLLHRSFVPWTGTRYFDYPNQSYARTWRLWLGRNEIISATSLVAGGVTIPSTDYFLRRSDDVDEPPYTHVEIDLASSAAFAANQGTHQRSIALTGVYGHSAEETPAGALAGAISSTSATTCNCTNSAAVGVGSILRVDTERIVVTGKTMLDTGQNASALTASAADVSITGVTAGTIFTDEVIAVGSERMLVVDITGTTLTVKRAWDGTVLALHALNSDIYALRTLTVQRGALGTTAATHLDAAPLYAHVIPGLVNELCIAEALNTTLQRQSGYARVVGSGENAAESSGRGLRQIREDAYTTFGRKARLLAV